ncbi:MAG: tyrosine-protein phosphatase [Parachlamydia sp.]|nr:tyrosine-protein phosphatase [Parachlamydia sp.]
MFSLSKATSDPALPATAPQPAAPSVSAQQERQFPEITQRLQGVIPAGSASSLKTKHIIKGEAAPKTVRFAEQLAGNEPDFLLKKFIEKLAGEKHLTPWKRMVNREQIYSRISLYQAALPLTELSVKEAVDIGLIDHYRNIREHCKKAAIPFHHSKKTLQDRFVGTIPYMHNCITLKNGQYINASFVDGVVPIIMTQAPIPPSTGHLGTFEDFWQMVWENGCRQIVMLNRNPDEEYWPAEANQPVTYGKIEVTKIEETFPKPNSLLRVFTIRNKESGESRRIEHKQMVDWPEKGVPAAKRLLEFVRFCRENTSHEPFIVHCNYGAGRSGTFVLLYNLLSLLWMLPPNALGADLLLNFPSWLLWLRTCRANTVSEDSQFMLIYQIVRDVVQELDEADQ